MEKSYDERVAEIFERKLAEKGLDPNRDDLTEEELAELEELTKEAQDEAGSL